MSIFYLATYFSKVYNKKNSKEKVLKKINKFEHFETN